MLEWRPHNQITVGGAYVGIEGAGTNQYGRMWAILYSFVLSLRGALYLSVNVFLLSQLRF